MPTIKLKGPENAGGFSHAGVSYETDKNGVIEIPSEISPYAKAHGFTPLAEVKPKTPMKLESDAPTKPEADGEPKPEPDAPVEKKTLTLKK